MVDATGLGAPVLEMLEARGLQPVGITISGGQRAHRNGRHWTAPKADIADAMAVDLEQRRLKITPNLPHTQTLLDECRAFVRTVTRATGRETFEGRGAHDDMVLAVAMAVWYANTVAGWELGGGSIRWRVPEAARRTR